MYYHASQTKGIKELIPHLSSHNKPLVYFSEKRENVLVYLSNAIEKFCKENHFKWDGVWNKWASYGFGSDGIQIIQEYYPNALEETYKGVSGYIYCVQDIKNIEKQGDIPFAYITSDKVIVDDQEFIEDAYEAILEEEKKGSIRIVRYEEFIKTKKDWLNKMIKNEYLNPDITPDYKFFLEKKFKDILK